MTNEEKLKKLLEIAVENGWEDEFDFQYTLSFDSSIIKNKYIFEDCGGKGELHSLNDLVTNWEEGEVSFIEALCRHSHKHFKGVLEKTEDLVWLEGMDIWEQLISSWNTKKEYYGYRNVDYRYSIRPTSQRLEWLFETFKHLLN